MKIYHTETQADYDALMVKLGIKGIGTLGKRYWEVYENQTVVFVHALCRPTAISRTDTAYGSLEWALQTYPKVPIQKYKAKADEKMRFNKQNIERAFDEFMQGGNDSFADLKESIMNLVDEPKKVVIPKFVADYIDITKNDGVSLERVIQHIPGMPGKVWGWKKCNLEKFIRAWIDDYEIEKEPLYRVELPQFQFDEEAGEMQTVNLCLAWDFQSDETRWIMFSGSNTTRFKTNLTEEIIKSLDERFWAFAVPVEEGIK